MSAPADDLGIDALAGVDPIELVERLLPRWAASDGRAVWISRFDDDAVRARAKELDALGPDERAELALFGVPFAVKDNIDVAGLPTTAACPAYAYTPEHDAPIVAALLAAGAICVGKTNLDQFATGLIGTRSPYGSPVNPIDPTLVPGGSSSGSAVAVASGLVSFALGTDTAGSGRVPAANCGIVGLKPAVGELSIHGIVPACRSLDCPSVFATSVADAVAVHGVLAGRRWDAAAATGPFTIAVPDEDSLAWCAPAVRDAFAATVATLARAGHRIDVIDMGPFFATGDLLYDGPWIAERTASVGDFIAAHDGEVHPAVRDLILGGRHWSAVDAHRGRWRLDELRGRIAEQWRTADALLTPTAPDIPTVVDAEADSIGVNRPLGRYTNFMNLLGLIGLAVPGAARTDGRPFGVTVAGPPSSAAVLAALGSELTGEPTANPSAIHPAPTRSADEVLVAVVGAHLRGFPLNHQLTDRGGRLVATTTTAPAYRLYRLPGEPVSRPALQRVSDGGQAIEVEVWSMPVDAFGSFVTGVAAPLGIGTVALVDGSRVCGFICEAAGLTDAEDITEYGGWRAAQAARAEVSRPPG